MSEKVEEKNGDLLNDAFLQSTISEDTTIAVKAEDLEHEGSGIKFSDHYFEPEVGNTYLVKILPNPGGPAITHRSVYKRLPDPERKGKAFHYTSSGNAKTCEALDLFFELHELKKNGDSVAEKKISKYLGRTNQACVKVQILESPKKEQIGMIRMMSFSSFGPNATVANLIDKKINPTKDMLKQGFEKEDIFDIFESSVLMLVCKEETYDGVKGRDFTETVWAPKKRGAIVVLEDESIFEFKKEHNQNGTIDPKVQENFKTFVANVTHENYDIRKYFAYKEIDDEKNDKDTNDYLKSTLKKVEEIIPIIREKTLVEIAQYGKKQKRSEGQEGDDKKKTDVYADSIPDELAGSVLNPDKKEEKTVETTDKKEEKTVETTDKKEEKTVDKEKTADKSSDDVEDILNS